MIAEQPLKPVRRLVVSNRNQLRTKLLDLPGQAFDVASRTHRANAKLVGKAADYVERCHSNRTGGT